VSPWLKVWGASDTSGCWDFEKSVLRRQVGKRAVSNV
jgi:hypothetical protein